MSEKNKVVWSEGLFLRPQHLQQQERYLEYLVESRATALVRHAWGCLELEIDRTQLSRGKLALRRASGVFPDGTPFSMPDEGALPPPIDVPPQVRGKTVYLAVTMRRTGAVDISRTARTDDLFRFDLNEWESRDATRESSELVPLEVATVRARLIIEGSPTEGLACIPVAQIVECRADQQLVLDDQFMPTVLDVAACEPLARFRSDLAGMVKQHADMLASVVAGTSQGSVAQIADLMRLQVLNRCEPLLKHLSVVRPVHPEEFFQFLMTLAGELAALSPGSRRMVALRDYMHHQLQLSFAPLFEILRLYISDRGLSNVVSIPVELRQANLYLARVADSTLFDQAVFILAAHAEMSKENLKRSFPQLATVAPSGLLKRYVEGHLPGIELEALTTIPPRLPFHAGYVYFELNRANSGWRDLRGSGGFGIFVREGFSALQLEMWALRN